MYKLCRIGSYIDVLLQVKACMPYKMDYNIKAGKKSCFWDLFLEISKKSKNCIVQLIKLGNRVMEVYFYSFLEKAGYLSL